MSAQFKLSYLHLFYTQINQVVEIIKKNLWDSLSFLNQLPDKPDDLVITYTIICFFYLLIYYIFIILILSVDKKSYKVFQDYLYITRESCPLS